MRRSRRHSTLRAARRATAAALLLQWLIVVSGATVRLTGSGLGCPNWPTCTDTRAVPALEHHALIEFVNRMMATPTLLTALLAAWVAWRLRPARLDLRIATTLVVAGVLVQAVLGALTVLLGLPPAVVSAHFLVSIGLLAAATFAWQAAASPFPLRLVRNAARRVAAGAGMLGCLLLVIVAGVLTTASGPHSGAGGSGIAVDRLDGFGIIVALHARGAWAFLVLVALLTWWRRRLGSALRDLAVLTALVALQVALGELQYRTGLPWFVVLAHVANAALLWIVACRIAVEAAFEPAVPDLELAVRRELAEPATAATGRETLGSAT